MEATGVPHMIGGTGQNSYSNNSSLQRKAITNAMPIMEEAIKDVYYRLLPKTLSISDMGCSSGPNTFYAIYQLVQAVDSVRRGLGHESPDFLIHLNDLPSNDFNTIFRSFPKFKENIGSRFGPCFLSAVPGSFYERLFSSQSLHFVHSSYSLHWLSQAPVLTEGNKGNIHISTTSPSNVASAYLKQFYKDFSRFLSCRAAELVAGGCIVLTVIGRRLEDARVWESQNISGPLSITIKDLVYEGLIEEEKLDSFNMPVYYPSVEEIKGVVEEEGSFTICCIGLADVHWNVDENEFSTPGLLKNAGLNVAKALRPVFKPLLANHFGEHVMDEVFSRFAQILSDCMSKEKAMYLNITVSLTKKD